MVYPLPAFAKSGAKVQQFMGRNKGWKEELGKFNGTLMCCGVSAVAGLVPATALGHMQLVSPKVVATAVRMVTMRLMMVFHISFFLESAIVIIN
jgi:hypothetical protein